MPHPVPLSFRPQRVGRTDTETKRGPRVTPLAALVLALPAVLGTIALLAVTRKGAYASPDSAFYVGVARNLIDGNGFDAPPGSVPLSHFPPLFPMLLAAVAKLTGADPLDVASVVNPVLLGATALLMASVVWRTTRSLAAGVLASTATVVSLDLLVYYGAVLSEPLFLLLALASLAATARYLESGTGRWLVIAATLAAVATLARYTGVAVIVAGLVAVIWRNRVGSSIGRTASRVAAFSTAAVAPTILWLSWAGSGDRPVAFHPPGTDYLVGTARSLSAWLIPRELGWPARGYVGALVVAVAVALVSRARRNRVTDEERRIGDGEGGRPAPELLLLVLGAFAIAYLALMMVTRTFLDASADLDLRLLTPLHLAAILALAVVLVSLLGAPATKSDTRKGWAGAGVTGAASLVVAVLSFQGASAAAWVVHGIGDDSIARRGLAAAAWSNSSVMATLSRLPDDVLVYSNAPDAIYLLTKRRALVLPPTVDYLTGEANPSHALAMLALNAAFEDHRAALAWFDAATWRREYLPSEQNVLNALGIESQPTLDDAVGRLYVPAAQTRSSSATR